MVDKNLKNPVTLYYDGLCPLCSIEIRHYRNLDKAARIKWIDINTNPDILIQNKINFEEAMDLLHVQDTDGSLLKGFDGFMVVWSQLPYYKKIIPVIRYFPGLKFLLNHGYLWFARHRLALTRRKKL